MDELGTDAVAILRRAVEAVDPYSLTAAALGPGLAFPRSSSSSSICLIAAGKAAWPMTLAACAALGTRVVAGMSVGPRGPGELPTQIQWMDGAHPFPDDRSARAGARALELAGEASAGSTPVLLLLSGGASAMLAAPAPGITIEDKRRTADALMKAGADIAQLNCVRKHLSAVKGGRLGARAGECLTLAISDVHAPPDDPATIASGPAAADPTTFHDALQVLDTTRCEVPDAVRAHLHRGADGRIPETLKPGDPRLAHCVSTIIGNRFTAMEGAAREARRRGYVVRIVHAATRGEARTSGRLFAELGLATPPVAGPMCVIASGETTVRVRGDGKGGRNQEFVLGAASPLAASRQTALVASLGTDGVDGPTDAAGAVASSTTAGRAAALGFDLDDVLNRNDAYPLLDRLGHLIKWGPTLTNVGDVHILLTIRS